MILGNSNGRNRGKKYFKKRRFQHRETTYSEQSKLFNDWFVRNTKPLKTQLFRKYRHPTNEDIFNDTYLRIFERIFYTGYHIADYKSYFCRAFYTNHIQELMKNNRFAEIDLAAKTIDDTESVETEIDSKFKQLESDIFEYVYQHFDLREYEIFKMYMRLKIQGKSMTYDLLADIVRNDDFKPHNIQFIISRIKKSITSQFSDQWKRLH